MFDPAEFFDLAHELGSADGRIASPRLRRACVRTSFGRAYYGLFLIVRSAVASRHGIPLRQIRHGDLYTNLQNSRLGEDVRALGRYLQHLYSLRQKADYETQPRELWERQLEDRALARKTVVEARRFALAVPHLDFSPIVHLF